MVSFVMALAVSSLVIGMTSSAPLRVKKEDRNRDTKVAEEKLMNTLQHLMGKKTEAMAINELRKAVSDQGKTWSYPPQLVESQRRKHLSPMMKAAHRHFHVSEPDTGPILNHPLDIDVGTKTSDEEAVQALINQLFSLVD